jgi:hypothetical protein
MGVGETSADPMPLTGSPVTRREPLFSCLCPNPICKVRNQVYDEYDNCCFNCGEPMFPNPREALADRYEATAGDGMGGDVLLMVGLILSVFFLLGLPIVLWLTCEGIVRGRLRKRAMQIRRDPRPPVSADPPELGEPVAPKGSALVKWAAVVGWTYWVLWCPALLLLTNFEPFYLIFIPLSLWALWKLPKAVRRLVGSSGA